MDRVRVTAVDVRRFRFARHQLDRSPHSVAADAVAILDFGVQDTGHDGAGWALALRGAEPAAMTEETTLAWTLRGAPHAYRRRDLAAAAVATAPLSERDARKRVFDAAQSLTEAGIPVIEALTTVADELRDIASSPTVKGEVSGRLTERVEAAFLRECRSCRATHVYENLFRLATLQGGLGLEAGTSPPVLRRVPRLRPNRYRRLGGDADPRLDVIRNYLRFYGPAKPNEVSAFLDAPVKEIRAHWPDDAVEVDVTDHPGGGGSRFALADDVDGLAATAPSGNVVKLLGPYDPYLQVRDRELIAEDGARRKSLWPVLGRPGAVVRDGDIVGTWRPRTERRRLTIEFEPWTRWTKKLRTQVEHQAQRLAEHRGVDLAGVDVH